MTWKDKLEIGLKDDAPFRKDNLPEFQQKSDARERQADDETRSAEDLDARAQAARKAGPHETEAPGQPAVPVLAEERAREPEE
jgi:hypothetical protein